MSGKDEECVKWYTAVTYDHSDEHNDER